MEILRRFHKKRYAIPFVLAAVATFMVGVQSLADYAIYHGEISPDAYRVLNARAVESPDMIPVIRQAMADGKITGYEERDFQRLDASRDVLQARKNVLVFKKPAEESK